MTRARRIVVPGGSGLLGRAVTAQLATEGWEVTVLSRRAVVGLPPGVGYRLWDGRSGSGWEDLVDGAEAVLLLAGENLAAGRWTRARKARIVESRLDSTRAVVAAIEKAREPPRVLLQGSAVGVYGSRGEESLEETSSPGEGFLADLCVRWEAASSALDALGVRRVLLRTGIVLAREGGALPRLLTPFRLGFGAALGGGAQWFPWIHAADESAAIRFLLAEETAAGPVNLVAPGCVRNLEFARALGRALRRPAFLRVPAAVLRLLAGEMAQSLLSSERAVPRRLLDLGFPFRFPGVEDALADLVGAR